MGHMSRILACCIFTALASAAPAQTYPDRPIRMIVSIAAGSVTDVIMRAAAAELGPRLGQQLVIENRGGASGIPAAQQCAQASPDGYTVCVIYHSTLAFNPLLFNKLPYDADKDFALIARLFFLIEGIAVTAGLNVNSVAELKAMAQAKPSALNYGTLGPGSYPDLFLKWLNNQWSDQHRRDSLSRRRADRPGAGGRRPADRQYGSRQLHAAARRRQDQAGRGGRADALIGGARRADLHRGRARRLSGARLVGHRGAGRHPAADHRQA